MERVNVYEWMKTEDIVDPNYCNVDPRVLVKQYEEAIKRAEELKYDVGPLKKYIRIASGTRILRRMYPSPDTVITTEDEARYNLTVISNLLKFGDRWPKTQYIELTRWRSYWKDAVRNYGMDFGGNDAKKSVNTKHRQRKAERAAADRELRSKMRGK